MNNNLNIYSGSIIKSTSVSQTNSGSIVPIPSAQRDRLLVYGSFGDTLNIPVPDSTSVPLKISNSIRNNYVYQDDSYF